MATSFLIPIIVKPMRNISNRRIAPVAGVDSFSLREIGKISCGLLHDLINPINGLTLYLETLDKSLFKELLIPINETSENIRTFIRVMQGAIHHPHQMEIINVYKIISHIVSLLRHKAISKNISVIVAQDTQNILIFASKVKVYQVFINLITNAIDSFEHAPEREKKNISISVTSEAGQIVVVVNDNGSGIPKENLNRLFVRSFTTKKTGLGIGLMHTQQLVQKDLLGKIKVRSEIGVGTEFKIYISKKFLISR